MNLTKPEQIDYSIFYHITPGSNILNSLKIIEASNLVCRPDTKTLLLKEEVMFLNSYLAEMQKEQNDGEKEFGLDHVIVYSSLSKCRIWPKLLKTGIGLVPALVNFYNSFTKKYNECLDFKFDPLILTQKYTKIMKKVNDRKRDHPQLVKAVIESNIEEIKRILGELQNEKKEQEEEESIGSFINNIVHKGLCLSHICVKESSLTTIKYLAEIGIDFENLDDEKQTAVFYAVKRADMDLLKFLIEDIKVNINHREYQDRSLLYLAAFEGELAIVDYLYKKGADPELGSKLDRTPLSKACYLGNVEVVKYLLSINVDLLKQDNKGRTALHNAAWGAEGGRDGKRRGHIMLDDSPESVELLIESGHPVDLEDNDGFTALFSAVSSKALKSMVLLIKKGASLDHKTKNKENACFIAAKYGHLEILKILVEEYNISYTEPDYHGYSSLCAAVTLEDHGVFSYLLDLYLANKIDLELDKIVESCKYFDTSENIIFFKRWLEDKNVESKKERENKVIYLLNKLPEFVCSMKKIKREMKENEVEKRISKEKRSEKYKNSFKTDDSNKESQLAVDAKNEIELQNKNYHKEKEKLDKILANLFELSCDVVLKYESIIEDKFNQEAIDNRHKLVKEKTLRDHRLEFINFGYKEYLKIILWMLSECINKFNSKNNKLGNQVAILEKLAIIINPHHPTIPPFQQQLHLTRSRSFPELTVKEGKEADESVDFVWLSTPYLKITHYQEESDLIKIITNNKIATNLVSSAENVMAMLFRLVKYRKTAVIINLLSAGSGFGEWSHERLIRLILESKIANEKQPKGQEKELLADNDVSHPHSEITLIQYCLINGISDIAVYLQSICNSPEQQSLVHIPAYKVNTEELTEDQICIELEAVEEWTVCFEEVVKRMGDRERQVYKGFADGEGNSKFKTGNRHLVVENLKQLEEMEKGLSKSVLIGIDVEHYNVSREECFVCSIQVSNGEMVYILDPLSHLKNTEDCITPEIIGDFINRLMGDNSKIKIYHAYENDVKWLHEDFILKGSNVNVVDTSKIFGYCNSIKKGESVGLRTLSEKYIGYHMDKGFQRSDWRIRPLFTEMVQYAAIDAEVLPFIYLKMLKHIEMSNKESKIKGGFCVKRSMKSRAVRNRLVKVEEKSDNLDGNKEEKKHEDFDEQMICKREEAM